MSEDGKAQHVIGWSLSDKRIEHMSDVCSTEEMWNMILNLFECPTLLYNLAARRKFCTFSMAPSENVVPYINSVMQPAGTLKSMNLNLDDKEKSIALLNLLQYGYMHQIVALDTILNEDGHFIFE